MTDNRTNEITEEQVEAAAKAMWDLRKTESDPEWGALEYGVKQEYRKDARAALVAAQGAAPQAESNPTSSYISPSLPGMICNLWKSDPSENSVRTALKLAGDLIQELIDLKASAVLPSSGVDEDALAEAWEAGCLAGRNRKHHTNMTEEQAEKAWPNPYRAGDGESRG